MEGMWAPKVSVIIPNYNHGNHLRQRIDSVLNQTFRDFEVIILDDHSSDNSHEVIQEYAGHPLIKNIIFNNHNSGNPFKQWQRGLELAKGDWIWFAESDDFADHVFLDTMMNALSGQQNVGLIYCDSRVVNNDMITSQTFASLKNQRFETDRWSNNYVNEGVNEIEYFLLPGGTINNSSAVLFNKKALFDAAPFDRTFRYIGDKYTFIKVLAKTNVVYVKESMNYYRDPFNTKHADRFVFYFYEQFLVFDWVYKNIALNNLEKFWAGFYSNTSNSLWRGWNTVKLSLYGELLMLNPYLFMKCTWRNLWRPIFS